MLPRIAGVSAQRAWPVASAAVGSECRTIRPRWGVDTMETSLAETNIRCQNKIDAGPGGNAMKKVIGCAAYCLVLIGMVSQSGGAEPQARKWENLYERWHTLVAANPLIDVPTLFSTNFYPEMGAVLAEIYSNRLQFAFWLCNRMVTNQYSNMAEGVFGTFCKDLMLLDEISGVTLIYPLPGDEAPGYLERNFRRFQQEWKEGKYEDPSEELRKYCESKLGTEVADKLEPGDLLFVRRYGIFGLPELIRQMRKNNSKHAFAAYLIITGHRGEYADYIVNSNQGFTNAEAKLRHVRKWLEGARHTARGAESEKLIESISKALEE